MRQLEARRAEVALISTRAAAEARGKAVREKLLRMMGGLPGERAPLNVRRAGVIDRGDYRIEKLIYESLPKFYVTANLYVPKGAGRFPAVLQPTGHSVQAKSRAFYQTLGLALVKSGFVVLTYDPLGQGERRLFYDRELGDSKVGGPTAEHSMVGIQSLLAGESVARYMVWDAMRGIDVLLARPEVDGKRIGVAGCSGGGTLTAYMAALDSRVQAAAPACYMTAWEEQLEGTGPQDAEQQFPDQLKEGLNHGDFAIAFAPKPMLIVSTEEDFFPIKGSSRTFEEAKRIYALFQAEDKIARAVGPGGHGMPQVVREAVYGWMNRWLKGGPAGPLPEPAFETEFEQALYCTPTGQVSTSLGGETASTLNVRRLSAIHVSRPVADLETRIRRLTRYEPATGPVRVETGQPASREGYTLEPLVFQAAGGRRVKALRARPHSPRAGARPVLLVAEEGSARAMAPKADGDALARAGHTVLAVDAAGFGESAGDSPEKLAWLGLMTGRPLAGLGIEDILRGLDVLGAEKAAGVGRGLAGVALLHAAALDKRFSEVVIEGGLLSYGAAARAPIARRILAAVIPGVLGEYDLPDLAAAIAPRPLTLLNTRRPAGDTALVTEVEKEYRAALDAYAAAGAAKAFTIAERREGEALTGSHR